jgi:hypothetical protein
MVSTRTSFEPAIGPEIVVYKYVNRDELQAYLQNGVGTNSHGDAFFTPHLFRFAKEARAFLALPPHNSAEVGLVIDPSSVNFPLDRFARRLVRGNFGQLGGAIELIVNPTDAPGTSFKVIEYFYTHLGPAPAPPDQNPPNLGSGWWDFRFHG